jgi:hypothetical protein
MNIFVNRNGQQFGPLTEADVRAKLATGEFSLADLVWWDGQPGWIPLSQSVYAGTHVPVIPPPVSPAPAFSQPVRAGQKTSGLAMAALITGIVSTITCGALFLPAIILGHLGMGATKNPAVQGRGMAIAGLVLGYVQLVIFGLVLLLFSAPLLALIGLGAAVKAENAQAQMNSGSSVVTTNSDSSTNGPDQTTSVTPAPSTNSDQPTNAPASNSSTNAPASTNAAPGNP